MIVMQSNRIVFLLLCLLFGGSLPLVLNAQSCNGSINAYQSYVCPGGTGTYEYVSFSPPFTPTTTFFWAVGSAGTIVSGQGTPTISVEWNYPFGGSPNGSMDVAVDVYDSPNSCLNFTFITESQGSPSSGEGPIGTTVAQVGDTSYYLTRVFDGINSSPYSELTVNGGRIVSVTGLTMSNSLFFWSGRRYGVVWDSVGTGELLFTTCDLTNFGCCQTLSTPVAVSSGPSLSANIYGPEVICELDTGTYFTDPDPGFNFTWVVKGGYITGGQGTPQITVDWGANNQDNTAGYVCLTKTGSGLGVSSVKSVSNAPSTAIPGLFPVLYGPDQVCGGTIKKYYFNAQMDSYAWTVTGGNLVAGQGTDTILVQWPPFSSGSGTVSASASTTVQGCSFSSLNRSMTVNYSSSGLSYPQVLASPTAPLNSTVTYSTPLNAGHTYSWTITGGTILSGQGTNQVTVQWTSAGNQSLTVTETGPSCGPSSQVIPVNVTGFNLSISATDTTVYAYGATGNCTQLTALTSPNPSNPTYTWSNGGTSASTTVCPSTTTTYTVTVSDPNLGTQTSSFTVTVLPAPSCNGSGVLICRNFGAFTFTQCVQPFLLPTYLAQGATLGPCPNKTGPEFSSIEDFAFRTGPNPWDHQFQIEIALPVTQDIRLTLCDATGRVLRSVFEGEWEAGQVGTLEVQAEGLAAGLYLLRMETETEGVLLRKVVRQP